MLYASTFQGAIAVVILGTLLRKIHFGPIRMIGTLYLLSGIILFGMVCLFNIIS